MLMTLLPEGWRDDSSIVYTRAVPVTGQPNASLTVRWEPATPATLNDELARRAKRVAAAMPGFALIGHGDAGLPDDPIPFLEYEVDGPVPLTQILLVRRIDGLSVWLTGQSGRALYARDRQVFLEAARNLQRP